MGVYAAIPRAGYLYGVEKMSDTTEYIIEWSGIGRQLAELSITKPQIVWPKYIRKERLREPIVRCRDCVHYEKVETEHRCFCFRWYELVKPDGFCAWGKKKNECQEFKEELEHGK